MQELKRILGFWDSTAINVSIIIGVGIFRVPSEVAKYLSCPVLFMLAWVLGGVISLLGAFCYAELSSSFPKTGGNYVYLKESYGLGMAFLFAWAELLVIRTGSIAALAFIFAEYLQSFLSLGLNLIKPIAVSIIIFISFINIIGLHYGKKLQDISIILKILAMSCVIVFGFISKKGNIANFYSVPYIADKNILSLMGLALIPILWTYGGWHESTFVAEETKDARRIIPRALIASLLIVIPLYLAINFLYIYLIPVKEIANSSLIASDVLQILVGKYGKKIFEILVIISSLGCINAMIITGSRITYAMAKDNIIFRYMSKVNARYHTPCRAIIINGIWSILLITLGNFNELLFFTGIIIWLFFALVAGAVFILRYKFPNLERPYKVWGYPLVPAIFVLICAALVVNTVIFSTCQAFIGLCILISGVPLYIISRKIKRILFA